MSNPLCLMQQADGLHRISFHAMGSPCEVMIDHVSWIEAAQIGQAVFDECQRIESKYSRYRHDSVIGQLHQQSAHWFEVDEETTKLLNFADLMYQLSNQKFDITSGILGTIWRFDGSDRIPSDQQIDAIRAHIGWHKVKWQPVQQRIYLPQGMSLDLGGIGKEYAVDRCADQVEQFTQQAYLINFGGDLRARGPRRSGLAWKIGLEDPDGDSKQSLADDQKAQAHFDLTCGAMATSGDSKRYLIKNGIRYSHILNPLTGYAMQDAPRSVTVYAPTCIEAGMLATLAMLEGRHAKAFLAEQAEGRAWIIV